MRPSRALLLSMLLIVALPVSALASDGIVSLCWDDCGAAGRQAEIFACNTNTGTHTLILSYLTFAPMDSLNGNEIVIDMQTATTSQVSPWWQVKTYTDASPACRNSAMSVGFDFTSGPFSCFDFWKGRALGGYGIIRQPSTPNRQRILSVCAVALTDAGPLAANVETYSCRFVVTNAKTTGAGACGSCGVEATLVPTSILATQNNEIPDRSITTAGAYAMWNPVGVATRNSSWGAIKSMYR